MSRKNKQKETKKEINKKKKIKWKQQRETVLRNYQLKVINHGHEIWVPNLNSKYVNSDTNSWFGIKSFTDENAFMTEYPNVPVKIPKATPNQKKSKNYDPSKPVPMVKSFLFILFHTK
jgi:hypothetical protein